METILKTNTMTKIVGAAAFLALAICPPAHAQTFYHYGCDDGRSFDLAFYPETKAAYLQVDGKSLMLPKRFSLTSQRFAKDGVTLRMKGGGVATIRRAGATSNCKVQ
jgi:hypothetical protein